MKFTNFFQNVLKVTKSELTVIAILLLGLLLGYVNKTFLVSDKIDADSYSKVSKMVDSLTKADRTTYIGTDIRGNSYQNLSKADTLVKKEELFPNSKKKEIPTGSIININTASRVQLMQLPGIGEKTAQKIIDYRTGKSFQSVNELMNVKGIGPKKFEKMKAFIKI